MAVNKWDVVFISFPNQEDPTKTTPRPAVVLDVQGDNVLICPITKQLHQKKHYNDVIEVDINSNENVSMKLNFTSLIVLDRQETVNKRRVKFTFGKCDAVIQEKIKAILNP